MTVLRRAGAAAAVTLVGLVLLAAPALANDSGEEGGSGLSFVGGFVLFVLIPLVLFLLLAGLALLPRLLHRPRYRPGRPWPYDPVWFAGPESPDAAIAGARPLRGTGGASAEW